MENQFSDPNSIASQVEDKANTSGDIIWVTVVDESASGSAFRPPNPDAVYTTKDGQIVVGSRDGVETGTADGGLTEGDIPITATEAFEHELSHALDYFDPNSVDKGVGYIDGIGGGYVTDADTGRCRCGRAEARAINRTNIYRRNSGSKNRRTQYNER